MPKARIAIEQTQTGWTAELEAGGVMARCRALRADSFAAIMEAVAAGYREIAGAPTVAPASATPPSIPTVPPDRPKSARPARPRRVA